MRRTLAIAFVLSVAMAVTVRADGGQDASTPRNPIEWLFSDIGKLFAGSATTGPEAPQPPMKVDTESAPAPQPDAAAPMAAARVTPETAPTSTGFKNPFAALFQDLARLLNGNAEASAAAATSAAEAAPAPIPESAPEPVIADAAPETPTVAANPATAETPAQPTAKRNAITWLFDDLADLFTPPHAGPIDDAKDDAAAVTALQSAPEIEAKPEMPPQTQATLTPVASTPTHLEFPTMSLFDRIAGFFEPDADAGARSAADVAQALAEDRRRNGDAAPARDPATETATHERPVEAAPWLPTPHREFYDPHEPLFDGNHRLAPLPPAPAPDESAAATAEPVQAPAVDTPAIRKRKAIDPAARNYRPLGAGGVRTVDAEERGIFDNFLDAFIAAETEDAETVSEPIANKVSDRIVPDEKLDLGYASPDADLVERSIERISEETLADIDLYMGENIAIGMPYDAAGFGRHACIERPLQSSVFCLKDMYWPADVAEHFSLDTAFTLPGEGIVRFENGTVSRAYAIFPASAFADIVKFMQRRFGPPQEREVVWMPVMEAPKLPNTTFRWATVTPDRRDKIVLEVRNYDDQRRSFADMEHGMVRLFRDGSRPIFKHLSTMDLMLMQRRRISQNEPQ